MPADCNEPVRAVTVDCRSATASRAAESWARRDAMSSWRSVREGEGAGQEGGVEESEGGGSVRRRRMRRRGGVRRRRRGRMRERGGGISAGLVHGHVVVSFKRAARGALGSDGCALVCATNARVECELQQQAPNGDGLGWGCSRANGKWGGGMGRER